MSQDKTTDPASWTHMDEAPRVWFQHPIIVTRNSDGGTSGWSVKEARELYRHLGEILGGIDGK